MSNVAKVYSQITGRQERHNNRNEDNVPPNAQLPEQQLPELSGQNKIDWLQHPRTQQMFEGIGNEIRKLEMMAIDHANSTLPTGNARLMEHCLVSVKTLQEVIRIYSSTSNQ